MFDQNRCGDNQPLIQDAQARLYFHRNIAAVAPNWRGGIDSDRREQLGTVPWPDEPTEQLVWFIRHDSGIWCPTRKQIKDHLAAGNDGTRPTTTAGPAIARNNDKNGQHRHVDQSDNGFTKKDAWHTPVGQR